MDIKAYIARLRAFPEEKKKIIFFSIMGCVALIGAGLGIFFTQRNLEKIGKSVRSIHFPRFNVGDYKENMPEISFTEVTPSNTEGIFQGRDANTDNNQ